MHRNYGNADIYGIDIEFCNILSNGTATAGIDFTEFRHLPINPCSIEHSADITDKFRFYLLPR